MKSPSQNTGRPKMLKHLSRTNCHSDFIQQLLILLAHPFTANGTGEDSSGLVDAWNSAF